MSILFLTHIDSFIFCCHFWKYPLIMQKDFFFKQKPFLIPNNILQDNLGIDKYIPKCIFSHLLFLLFINLPNLLQGRNCELQIKDLHIESSQQDLIDSNEIGLRIRIEKVIVPTLREELRTVWLNSYKFRMDILIDFWKGRSEPGMKFIMMK